jgi:Glycosyltransferase like family
VSIGALYGRAQSGAPLADLLGVIAFAACVGSPQKLAAYGAPGLRLAMEPDSVFAELATATSIHEAYNEALDHFAAYDDLEALVLLHEDTEIVDPGFCDVVREAVSDPRVAIAGPIGARDVSSLAWWEGELAGAIREARGSVAGDADNPLVDAVDGLMLVLSPWAVRNLRCDTETFTGFHAYDVDLCFQARAAGRLVRVAPFDVVHHTKGGYGNSDAWYAANGAFVRKWDAWFRAAEADPATTAAA